MLRIGCYEMLRFVTLCYDLMIFAVTECYDLFRNVTICYGFNPKKSKSFFVNFLQKHFKAILVIFYVFAWGSSRSPYFPSSILLSVLYTCIISLPCISSPLPCLFVGCRCAPPLLNPPALVRPVRHSRRIGQAFGYVPACNG